MWDSNWQHSSKLKTVNYFEMYAWIQTSSKWTGLKKKEKQETFGFVKALGRTFNTCMLHDFILFEWFLFQDFKTSTNTDTSRYFDFYIINGIDWEKMLVNSFHCDEMVKNTIAVECIKGNKIWKDQRFKFVSFSIVVRLTGNIWSLWNLLIASVRYHIIYIYFFHFYRKVNKIPNGTLFV